jgi:hypothetical protein
MADSKGFDASAEGLREKPNASDDPPGRMLTSVSVVSSEHQPSITAVFYLI